VPQIISAIALAASQGLTIPIVYNCSGYEWLPALQLLDGIVDIYMPDVKYADSVIGQELSKIPNYWEITQAALKEMHRQVGDLVIDERGIASRGLIVRHLVLPNNLAGTKEVMEFIAREISPESYINIMDQYTPEFKAGCHPQVSRHITQAEFREAITIARKASSRFRFAHQKMLISMK
jgi:putative pyruvate formate lyase activating enzyme